MSNPLFPFLFCHQSFTVDNVYAFRQPAQGLRHLYLRADANAGEGVDIRRCVAVGHDIGDPRRIPIPAEEICGKVFRRVRDGQIGFSGFVGDGLAVLRVPIESDTFVAVGQLIIKVAGFVNDRILQCAA